MRKLFLRAILVTILASCMFTAVGVGLYSFMELSRSANAARDLVFDDVEKRFRIFGQLLEISHKRMQGTAEESLLAFDRRYPSASSAFAASTSELRALADSLDVGELYVLDNEFRVRASSLPEDIGLDLDQGRQMIFRKFLNTVLGSGRIMDHGLSLSLRTSRINGYYYYSPSGSDYVLETSMGADIVLGRAFGESFYRDFLADLFIPMQTQSDEVFGADLFLFNGTAGVSFLGNKSDPFLTADIVSRLDSGEWIRDRAGWVYTEYRAFPLGTIPLSFVKTAYIRVSFDRRKYYFFGVSVMMIAAAMVVLITIGSFLASRPFFEKAFLRRLEALSSKINAVANGDYGVSFVDSRSDELSKIGADIERMVSEIVHGQERLRHAQKAELVALFSGGIAHDFNNLLSTVAGAASLLEERAANPVPGLDREIRDTAKIIRTAAIRAGAMTRDLVSLSKGDNGRQRTPVDMGALLTSISRLFSRSLVSSIRFVSGPFPQGVHVLGDDSRLRQLFLNLLINAQQAVLESPVSGRPKEIHISARVVPGGEPAPSGTEASGRGSVYEIRIADTGPGIPAEDRERVFTPFFTTKEMGMGVGLSMALATAKAHGGTIALLDSGKTTGTVFSIVLPLLDSAEDARVD